MLLWQLNKVGGVQDLAAVASEVARIKRELICDGESTVDRIGLGIFVPEGTTATEQFNLISKLAIKEGWSFTFLPDGSIRFGTYEVKAAESCAPSFG